MPEWQWHPSLHMSWADERLYFWRMAFSPTYDRAKVKTLLDSSMAAHGVSSFAIYELFGGGYDILLRVWLSSPHRELEDGLHHALREYAVVMQAFSVTDIVTHWPWADPKTGRLTKVSPEHLKQRLPDDEIAALATGKLRKEQRQHYIAEKLIADTPSVTRSRHIKFVTVVSAHHQPMSHYAVARFQDGLLGVLTAASGVTEKSLYAGLGFGQYLLMGRVKDYYDINAQIAEPIHAAVDPAMFGARTTTALVSTPYLLSFRDDIPRREQEPGALTLEQYLAQDESHTLEIKGSALVDIDRWALGDGQVAEADTVSDGGFLRAVTGMLNADGGTLIIGALEGRRYESAGKLADKVVVGKYLCLGIDIDRRQRDWDEYERKLRELLRARVRPDPNPWLELVPETAGGCTLCVVTVRLPDRRGAPGGRWFYHYPGKQGQATFWARQGNRTVQLSGPDLDVYRVEKGSQP